MPTRLWSVACRLQPLGARRWRGSAHWRKPGLFLKISVFSRWGLDFPLYFYNYQNMEMNHAIEALGALAQETRLEIFRALVQAHSPNAEEAGLPAGGLAAQLGVAAPTLSFHLKELTRAGLVSARRDGRSIIYTANLGRMRALADYLLEDCCQGACAPALEEAET